MLRTLICKQRYKILELTKAIPLKYYNCQGLLHSNENKEIPLFAYCYYFSNCMLSLFAMIYLKGEFRIFFFTTTDFRRWSSPPMQPFYHSLFDLEIKKISSVSRTVYEGTHKLKSVFLKNKASRVFFPWNKSLNLKNSFTGETLPKSNQSVCA